MNDLTLIRKNLFRRKLRAFLLLFSIFIAFLIYGVLVGFLTTFNGGTQTTAGQSRLITSNKINFTQPLPIAYFSKIQAMKGVELAGHANWFGGYYQDPRKSRFAMFAINPDTYLDLYPELEVDAKQRADFIRTKTGLMVGAALANQYGWKIGQQVPISSDIYSNKAGGQTWPFTVSAIFTSKDRPNAERNIYFHYDYYNDSVTFGQDNVGFVVMRTASPALNDSIARKIDAMFANSAAETVTQTEAAFGKAFLAQLGNIALIVQLVVGAAFATILMIVGNTMVMAIRERTREIGVLKTLGFSSPRILRMVLGESLGLALIGGLIGMLVALVASQGMNEALKGQFPPITLSPLIWAEAVGLMLALGLVTGLIPALNAMRLNILTALGRQ